MKKVSVHCKCCLQEEGDMICCEGCDLWYHKHGEKFYLVHVCSTCSNIANRCFMYYITVIITITC